MAIRMIMKPVVEEPQKTTVTAFYNLVAEGEEEEASAAHVEESGHELFINSFETTAGKKVVYIRNSWFLPKRVKQNGDEFIEDTSGDFTSPSIEIPPLESKTLFI